MATTIFSPSEMRAFEKYRPTSHFGPPHSWSNDPCGAVHIPETKEYLICYQWNPGTTEGGNSAWGMAKSNDLVTWHDMAPALTISGETPYDRFGVFSGSIVSTLLEDGTRVLYLFYTGIRNQPYPHWSQDYPLCEVQCVAISTDFGRKWHRYQQNPILPDAPRGKFTAGWRDPFVSEWKSLSKLRGVDLATRYMLISSGDKWKGPELFIYESQDLIKWEPLSVLLSTTADTPIAPGSDLHYGRNFECGSFFTIGDKEYICAGMEQHPSQTTRHCARYTLWLSGTLILNADGKPSFSITNFGGLDQGILYAPHVFRGPSNEILQLGWADEDDNLTTREQNWAGFLTHPREIIQIQQPIPYGPLANEHMWDMNRATNSMTTLGMRPASQVRGLRIGSLSYDLNNLSSIRSHNFEIKAKFTRLTGSENLVFNVRQAPHDREVTRIIISLNRHSITVDRSASSLSNGNPTPDAGPFQLLQPHAGIYEDLHVNIFVDNSLVEVFANDRFALSSRIYPTLESALGVSCDFRAAANETLSREQVQLECWDGLATAWPAREVSSRGSEIVGALDKNEAQVQAQQQLPISKAHLQTIVA